MLACASSTAIVSTQTKENFMKSIKFEKVCVETIAVDEAHASIDEMYARLVASGQLGLTVAHATANASVNEEKALAMLKDAAKAPQYMDLSETNTRLKRAKETATKLEMERLERVNKAIEREWQPTNSTYKEGAMTEHDNL